MVSAATVQQPHARSCRRRDRGRRAARAVMLALAIITNVDDMPLAVTRVLVFHKGLEFQPNFMGCLLDSKLMNRAMQLYHRFISRRQM
jgi:hypothetical protein